MEPKQIDDIIDIFREWMSDQCNQYGVAMPGDDWAHYDTGRLRRMIAEAVRDE